MSSSGLNPIKNKSFQHISQSIQHTQWAIGWRIIRWLVVFRQIPSAWRVLYISRNISGAAFIAVFSTTLGMMLSIPGALLFRLCCLLEVISKVISCIRALVVTFFPSTSLIFSLNVVVLSWLSLLSMRRTSPASVLCTLATPRPTSCRVGSFLTSLMISA